MPHYIPPEDISGTVFDPYDDTFGPIMAAIQAGDFELALDRISALTDSPTRDGRHPGVRLMEAVRYALGADYSWCEIHELVDAVRAEA